MKYQLLRLVSWVNSTQCSFKPIKRLQMSNINGHHQPAGFGLVLKCHLRCIFWEQQIDTLEIYILVCLHYVSKSNPRNQGFLLKEKANGDSRSWLFCPVNIGFCEFPLIAIESSEYKGRIQQARLWTKMIQYIGSGTKGTFWIHLSFKGRITLPLWIYLKICFGR